MAGIWSSCSTCGKNTGLDTSFFIKGIFGQGPLYFESHILLFMRHKFVFLVACLFWIASKTIDLIARVMEFVMEDCLNAIARFFEDAYRRYREFLVKR